MPLLSELVFSTGDLALTRFAVSPMWEIVTSYRLLASGAPHPVHKRWLDQVRPRVTAAGLHRGRLAALIPAHSHVSHGYIPDFLTPLPLEPAPSIETELAAVLATPQERFAADLARMGMPGDLRVSQVCDELRTYWELALAPYWAKIRAVLDADVYYRSRQAAERGVGQLFNDLHASLSWDENTLHIIRKFCGLNRERTGPGLLLIPSVFAELTYTWSVPPHTPQLAYPARGTGALWEHRPPARSEAIAAVIGRSRATLLTELEAPASTKELAERTGFSAAGVSQHLTALRDAGMVSAHRAGRSVLYARTAMAEAFLT